jgi:transcriptional regulatory protein LevR
VSNTNSDELRDKVDSKFDCECEVRNCIFVCLFIVVCEEKERSGVIYKNVLIRIKIEGHQ